LISASRVIRGQRRAGARIDHADGHLQRHHPTGKGYRINLTPKRPFAGGARTNPGKLLSSRRDDGVADLTSPACRAFRFRRESPEKKCCCRGDASHCGLRCDAAVTGPINVQPPAGRGCLGAAARQRCVIGRYAPGRFGVVTPIKTKPHAYCLM